MSTKILGSKQYPRLQPAVELWKGYRPQEAPYRFAAATAAAARAWQRRTRAALAETLGFQDGPACPPRPRLIERVDKGDYVREKLVIRTAPDAEMPVYLLVPKNIRKPAPVVLAFHGHGYGVKDIVGLWEDGSERNMPDGYHKDFGVAICRRGFIVAAPEISCFGERQTDFAYLQRTGSGNSKPSTCTHSAMLAFHLGLSVVGLRVRDTRRLVDYLVTRRDVDLDRLGAMGISGGGMHAFFSMCMDERIKAGVISGYYCTFRDSILAMFHCACNFVPGLHAFGEMYDLVGLIAPRPLLVEAGDHDEIFPLGAVRRSVARARAVYRLFGAARVETDYFEGRHQISGRKAYDFFARELNSGC